MNKKVLVLTTSFPIKGFPVGMHVFNKCKFLSKKGVEVTVVAPHHSYEKMKEKIDGFTVVRFPYFIPFSLQKVAYGSGMPQNIKGSLLAKIQAPFFLLSFFFFSLKYARKCDIIHAHWFPAGLIGVFLKKIFRKKLILMMHHTHSGNSLFRYILKNTDLLLANSSYVLKVTNDIYNVTPSKVVPIGLDIDEFSSNNLGRINRDEPGKGEDGISILSVGRFINLKGFEILIEALDLLINRWEMSHSFYLQIIGKGPNRKFYERLIEDFNLGKWVRLVGYVPNNVIHHYFEQADICVVPSIIDENGETEGFGVVAIEANAYGVPVIASKVGGLIDVIDDGYNGILVNQKDAVALAKKIIELADNINLRKKFGLNGKKKVAEKYNWDVITQDIINIYNDKL